MKRGMHMLYIYSVHFSYDQYEQATLDKLDKKSQGKLARKRKKKQ